MFPNKKWFFFNDGWKDLGKTKQWTEQIGGFMVIQLNHNFCHTKVKIGKEKGKLFTFCPKCMVKLD